MSTNDLNSNNKRLQSIGDIIVNLDFWDCECENDFIHPVNQLICHICGSNQEDSPSSRDNEVKCLIGTSLDR
jgi:hypothetical protein